MNHSKSVILYHVYGKKELYQQVLFSILTLHHHLQGDFHNIQIVIYTDTPSLFEKNYNDIPITIEGLNKDKINLFKGSQDFIHRLKICIIKDCFDKYNSNILYLDSDTYFIKNPKKLLGLIDHKNSLMHTNDYNLITADELFENMDWLSIRKAILNYDYKIDGKVVKIPLETRMWNAGVIGISNHNKHLVDKVLALSDQIYGNRKVFTAEQFAFSYILQKETNILPSDDVIFHYWPNHIGMYWKNKYSFYINKLLQNIKNKPLKYQSAKAYDLSLQHDSIIRSAGNTLLGRILRRLKLIKKVALKGRID